jgi:peptidoglycan DL-endopeptidase CwlO
MILPVSILAQTAKKPTGKPALITAADLADFGSLPKDRRKLIEAAITVARDSPWLPYTAQGSKPADGGFDCSGAMFFVMKSVGLDPPRTSAAQYEWLDQNERLCKVSATITDLKHPSLKNLRPADLLFWGRSAGMDSGAKVTITHVAMYLGEEAKDRHPVMINSTDGRTYRGSKANGYGVYDFRLPKPGSRISFIGYGTPPGIAMTQDK